MYNALVVVFFEILPLSIPHTIALVYYITNINNDQLYIRH